MTPAERQLVSELFDRLATLEDAQRDPAAEKAIKDGLRQAPNAVYSLVQTSLLQDAALKRADERIRQLEAELGQGEQSGSFLGGAPFGRQDDRRGSVPNVRPGGAPMQAQSEPQAQGGGSFLGTAAAAAAGAIGGSLLMDAIRGMSGGGRPGGLGNPAAAHGGGEPGGGGLPWNTPGVGGDLGRQAGIDDIGRSGASPFGGEGSAHAASGDPFETASAEDTGGEASYDDDAGFADDDDAGFDDDAGGDFDGGGDGDE